MKSFSDDLPNSSKEVTERTLNEAVETHVLAQDIYDEVVKGNGTTDRLLGSNESILGGITMIFTDGKKGRDFIRNLILLNIFVALGNIGIGAAMLLKMFGFM